MRMSPEEKIRGEAAQHEQPEHADERVAQGHSRGRKVADVVLDQVEPGRGTRRGQLGRGRARRRRATLPGHLDDDAVHVTGVQEGFLPRRAFQVDPDRLDAERPYLGQRGLDVADEEIEVVRPGAA